MTLVAPSTVDRVVNALLGYEPEQIIVFGSAARGDTDEYSDIDLIVIKETETRFVQRLVEVSSFLPSDLLIDVFVYTPEEFQTMQESGNPFIEEAMTDGKVLYHRDSGVRRMEEAPRVKGYPTPGGAFMKKPEETARRWLAQAEHSLAVGQSLLDLGHWSNVCFQAEQTAQLALKAFLYLRRRRRITMHSVRQLALECAGEDEAFSAFVGSGGILDRYYLSTRYPDAVAEGAVPFETFSQEEASRALESARVMVDAVRSKVAAES